MISGLRALASSVAAMVMFLGMSAAHAQAPEARQADRDDEARALFDRGFLALEAGHADEAAPLLRRSLELTPRPATAFNLALALRDIDEPRLAIALTEDLLASRYGAIDGSRRTEVERLRDQLAERLAALEVRIAGAERATLYIDQTAVATLDADTPHATWLSPGAYALRATIDDARSVEEHVDLAAGERTRVLLHLGGLGNELTTEPVVSTGSDGWLWAGILGGAGVAIAVVLVVLVVTASDNTPTVDPVYGRTETLLGF